MSNQSYGKFQLLKKLATGGMAEVFYARQRGIEGFSKEIVVKRILPHLAEDAEFVEMFKHEAVVAARFNHPNIAQVYEFAEQGGSYFIAMEYVHGEDLGRVMRKAWSTNQWIARPLAIRIIANAAEGLHYAHTRTGDDGRPLKVVHRDISPQNIIISFDGSVKVLDFGIAKAADQANLTKSGAIKGKFAYMAPEQAAGKPLDHRVDIFALGLVLYELITGTRPLKRDTELATLQAALEGSIQPPSQIVEDVPPELERIVMLALAKTPDDRYRDARQFQMALEDFLVGNRLSASSVQVSEMMETLFAERLEEEQKAGAILPRSESQLSMMPSLPGLDPVTDPATQRPLPDDVREGTQRATPRSLSRTNQARVEMPNVPEWEAPPATVAPRSNRPADARLRRNTGEFSRVDVTPPPPADEPQLGHTRVAEAPRRAPERVRPVPDRAPLSDSTRMELFPEPPAERPRRSVSSTSMRSISPPPAERAPTPAPRPRRTLSRAMRAVDASAQVAPVEPAPAPAVAPVQDPEVAALLALAKRQKLMRIGTGVGVAAAILLVVLFWNPLVGMLTSSAASRGTGVKLEVLSNLAVDIWVIHPPGESGSTSEVKTKLGSSRALPPTDGAHLGDLVVLENQQLGARYEKALEFGEPGAVITINHEFKKGSLRLNVNPRPLVAVKVYLDGQERGRVPGLIEFYEGTKTLELRSKAFREPKLVDVTIRPDSVLELNVDVRDVLNE